MEGITLFVSIVIIAFGILQIILFFKIWGMTDNVKELKNLYTENSKSLLSSIDRLTSAVKNAAPKEEKTIKKIVPEEKKEAPVYVPPKKELPVIDINSDEYKKKIHKLKVLKDKGFVEQAIKEYMEYTQLEHDSATDFINSL